MSAVLVSLMALGILSLATENAFAGHCDGTAGGEDGGNDSSLACGKDPNDPLGAALTDGPYSIAIGATAISTGVQSSAVGYRAVSGESGTALGAYSKAGAVGNLDARGSGATAIGMGATAGAGSVDQDDATALGHNSTANGLNASALGAGATANFTGSTAIGQGAATTRDNQVAIGTAGNTYTLAGVNSQASKDAQGATTYLMTTDGDGNLAASTFDVATLENLPAQVAENSTNITNLGTTVNNHTALINANTTELANHETRITNNTAELADHETRITGNTNTLNVHTTQIANLDTRVTTNTTDIGLLDGRVGVLESGLNDLNGEISATRTEARQGIAAAIAMSSAPMPSAAGRTTWSANVGYFKGEAAFGGSLSHRLDFDEPVALTLGYSYGGGDSHAARVGMQGEF